MRSCSRNDSDSNQPIGDQPIGELINRGQVLDMTVERNVPRFSIDTICG